MAAADPTPRVITFVASKLNVTDSAIRRSSILGVAPFLVAILVACWEAISIITHPWLDEVIHPGQWQCLTVGMDMVEIIKDLRLTMAVGTITITRPDLDFILRLDHQRPLQTHHQPQGTT